MTNPHSNFAIEWIEYVEVTWVLSLCSILDEDQKISVKKMCVHIDVWFVPCCLLVGLSGWCMDMSSVEWSGKGPD